MPTLKSIPIPVQNHDPVEPHPSVDFGIATVGDKEEKMSEKSTGDDRNTTKTNIQQEIPTVQALRELSQNLKIDIDIFKSLDFRKAASLDMHFPQRIPGRTSNAAAGGGDLKPPPSYVGYSRDFREVFAKIREWRSLSRDEQKVEKIRYSKLMNKKDQQVFKNNITYLMKMKYVEVEKAIQSHASFLSSLPMVIAGGEMNLPCAPSDTTILASEVKLSTLSAAVEVPTLVQASSNSSSTTFSSPSSALRLSAAPTTSTTAAMTVSDSIVSATNTFPPVSRDQVMEVATEIFLPDCTHDNVVSSETKCSKGSYTSSQISSSSNKRRYPKHPTKESQTTTRAVMDKMASFMKSMAKFHDVITVPNSDEPMHSTMSLTTRRQRWTNASGGKPLSGEAIMDRPNITVLGTSKERVIVDILEFLAHINTNDTMDPTSLRNVFNIVSTEVLTSVGNFLVKLFLDGTKDVSAVDEFFSKLKIGVPSSREPKPQSSVASCTMEEIFEDKGASDNLSWCLAGSGSLGDAVSHTCMDMFQQRESKMRKLSSSSVSTSSLVKKSHQDIMAMSCPPSNESTVPNDAEEAAAHIIHTQFGGTTAHQNMEAKAPIVPNNATIEACSDGTTFTYNDLTISETNIPMSISHGPEHDRQMSISSERLSVASNVVPVRHESEVEAEPWKDAETVAEGYDL